MSFSGERRRAVVRKLVERHGNVCHFCGVELDPESPDGRLAPTGRTVDHLIPRCDGGSHPMGNLVLACHDCNSRKGSIPASAFIGQRNFGR